MEPWLKKYPKTWHVPSSPGTHNDDKRFKNMNHFIGKEVVFLEKMDGENCSMSPKKIWARSLDSVDHLSRHLVKGIWGNIAYKIPTDWRICGENLYAEHSIQYESLESFFQVFNIWDENNVAISWDDTLMLCKELELKTVPILYRGLYSEEKLNEIISSLDLTKQEGVVVRNVESFKFEDFTKNVAKWVRKGHVQTDEHWMSKPVVPNKLKSLL